MHRAGAAHLLPAATCPATVKTITTTDISPLSNQLPPAATWYASVLLASLHEWNGVRYLRYSDLAASISGG